MKFTGTIEFVSSHRAIVELTDANGHWSGCGRVEVRHGGRDALYEAGYRDACVRASIKGGTLDVFREMCHEA